MLSPTYTNFVRIFLGNSSKNNLKMWEANYVYGSLHSSDSHLLHFSKSNKSLVTGMSDYLVTVRIFFHGNSGSGS